MKRIILAGGCFWGVDAYFQQVHGVLHTRVGYAQGTVPFPSYEQVCTGTTGHAEVCEIEYDETQLPLELLLQHFFLIINPTVLNRQGNDRGHQYRTGVYYFDVADREPIQIFLASQQPKYDKPIVVEVEPVKIFYIAEEYHQNYLKKNPHGYCHINLNLVDQLQTK
ncbi:MAG: peptide-methionine (S)-S-oxide reductase MsrA [Culicoidibacterales bacterium]